MSNFALKNLQAYGAKERHRGITRCNDWAGKNAASLNPKCVLDVGCSDGSLLSSYFKTPPAEYHGIEGSPDSVLKAERRGIKVSRFDLNGRWPYPDNKFDVVFSSQVIEHLHNTRLFVEEIYRVLKPGGTAITTSENLCSLLNWLAMSLGYTPFSLMQTCGYNLGNPIGLHYNENLHEPLPIDHPAFAGVSGHVRVLSVRQAKEIFDLTGFVTEASSISILPLPDKLSSVLESFIKHRGHYLLIKATKPHG